MSLTFFYKTRRKAKSGKIRGQQISSYLNAKQNPVEGYHDDVCVYVKSRPPTDWYPERSYVGVVDSYPLLKWVDDNPHFGVIAISKVAHDYMSKKLKRDDIYLIPEHHCNFNREINPCRDVKTVGYIGNKNGSLFPKNIKEMFAKEGFDCKIVTDYRTREQVVDFYKSIDIQVISQRKRRMRQSRLKNPLKIANASSFGVPTIAFPEPHSVAEFKGYFIEVNSISRMIASCVMLRDSKNCYNDMASKAIEKAEDYHISKIAELYLQL